MPIARHVSGSHRTIDRWPEYADRNLDGRLLRTRLIWAAARSQVPRSVNSAHVGANWLIGQQFVDTEQVGTGSALPQALDCWRRSRPTWLRDTAATSRCPR